MDRQPAHLYTGRALPLEEELRTNPLLSLPDVARMTGLGDSLVRRAAQRGELRTLKLSGRVVTRASWVGAWVDGRDQWVDESQPATAAAIAGEVQP